MRVLIADDELLARKRLQRLLGAMADVEVVGSVTTGAEVLAAIPELQPDVVLLDIQMPGLTGVEAMALWPKDGPPIVFTTAHAEHAVAAFAGGAADYVLKPVEPGRLRTALERVAPRDSPRPSAPRIALPTRTGAVLLTAAQVRCARIDGATVCVHSDVGDVFTELTLAELERRLDSPDLERCHRQALVNMARVVRLEDAPSGGYIAHTDAGDRVPVSRKAARELRRRWKL